MPFYFSFVISFLFMLVSCGGGGSTVGGGNPIPTPPGGEIIEPPSPGEEETVVIGNPGLCDYGDVARVSVSSAGSARFALVSEDSPCSPAKDNRLEEYSMILFNTSNSPIAFRLDSPSATNPFALSTQMNANTTQSDFEKPEVLRVPPKHYNTGATDMAEKASYLQAAKHETGTSPIINALMTEVVLGDEVEIKVRSDRDNDDAFITTSAILRAQGTNINLFVDRDVPMGGIHADSPTQQDLDDAVAVFDNNIYPLVTALMGDPSDVDNNDRINVVITPVMNRNIDRATYVDSRNAMEYNPISNPGSNEGEYIFIYAPDSLSNYTGTGIGIGNNINKFQYFKEKIFNGWMAFQLPKIISYNQKVLVNGGQPELDWIEDGVGAVMADLCGFNLFRGAAWRFLAAPQLDDLRDADDFEIAAGQGAEYLFMLYYVQSNLNISIEDSNANGFDDDLEFLKDVFSSVSVGPQNLVNFVDVLYDEDIETEFDGLFKDWTIALLTSGSGQTALQQSGQTALKYFLDYNPTVLGAGINDINGSIRVGADGGVSPGSNLDGDSVQNIIGLDLHAYNVEDDVLFENTDEYVYAPGNAMHGYIDPFSAMYVRLSGLLMAEQSIGLFSSSTSMQGFLVRREDLTYPKTYHESIFGAINQYYEDLDAIGPNPFWEDQGNAKRIDLDGLVASATINGTSEDFVSIVGEIDPSQNIYVCPANTIECSFQEVQDTDKYTFVVPDIGLDGPLNGRADEQYLSIAVRRRFDQGVDSTTLNPLLAIVSSKDVPYPYVPHPIRNTVNDGLGGTDTRQKYRWVTDKLICGDDQDTGLADGTQTATYLGADCIPRSDEDSEKVPLEDGGFVENTGTLLTSSGTWDGNIVGGDCNNPPLFAVGALTSGYGLYNAYPVTDIETSGSSLGKYSWSDSFMTDSYDGSPYPKILFDREFLKIDKDYPSFGSDTDPSYDPRPINTLSLNCHQDLGTGEFDFTLDAPDDFLSVDELSEAVVDSFTKQILTEMSRYRFASDGVTSESSVIDAKYDTADVFVIDGDSRDLDESCSTADLTNNLNTYTVRGAGEGSILMGEDNNLEPHIAQNLNSAVASQNGQEIYDNGGETKLKLIPGKSYTIIVGGEGGSIGDYEIRIRKVSNANKNLVRLQDFDNEEKCFLEL